MKLVTLPTGSQLEITLSPFAVSKALYQAVCEEGLKLKIEGEQEVDYNLLKDILLVCLSSKKIEACLAECMKKATYNGLRITAETFEPAEARADYFDVCFEVAKENIEPFMKSLLAQLSGVVGQLKNLQSVQASRSTTKTA